MKKAILCICFVAFPIQVITAQYILRDDDVVVENGVIQSCSYDFLIKDIIIPDTLDGQVIIGIADTYERGGVFKGKELASVSFPETMEWIGNYAFYDNRLWKINLRQCRTLRSIGNYAFSNNDLQGVDLEACTALQYIGHSAFSGNQISFVELTAFNNLTFIGSFAFGGSAGDSIHPKSFVLPENSLYPELDWLSSDSMSYPGGEFVTDLECFYQIPVPYVLTKQDVIVKNGMIMSCSYNYIKNIVIPDSLNGQWITGISDEVFSYKNLESVVLPRGLTHIGKAAFIECHLTAIDLPPGLISIGPHAFYYNSLSGIELPPSLVFIGKSAFYKNQLQHIGLDRCTALTTIGTSAFSYNELTDLDFSDCTSLVSIGEGAFIRNRLDSIDLSDCTSLISIEGSPYLRDSLYITLPINQEFSSYEWKDNKDSLFAGGKVVNLMDSYYYLPVNYTLKDEDLKVVDGYIEEVTGFIHRIITIPDTLDGQAVKGIIDGEEDNFGYWGVFARSQIQMLVLPETMETIGEFAFRECGLVQVDFSGCSSLRSIGEHAFRLNLLSILDLAACSELRVVCRNAFSGTLLSRVDLPTGLEVIESYAFSGTDSLDYIQLPIHPDYAASGWMDGSGQAYAAGDLINNFQTDYRIPVPYTLTDKDVEIVDGRMVSCSYDFYQKEIVIPDTLDGQEIREIDYTTLYFKGITGITLPGGMQVLDAFIFWGNDIEDVDLSHLNSLTFIDLSSFREGWVPTDFVLPHHGVYDHLGWKDDEGNSYPGGTHVSNMKTSYYIPASYTLQDEDVEIRDGVIQSCSYDFSIRHIIIPDTLDGQEVRSIANGTYTFNPGVFQGRGIKSITLPSRLHTIGDFAFDNNELDSLDLNHCSDLAVIGTSAFGSNKLKILEIGDCMSMTEIGSAAFISNRISSISLPPSLEKIGSEAFEYNPLSSINLATCTGLSYLGYSAFLPCYSVNYEGDRLNSIILPEHTVFLEYAWKQRYGEDTGISYYAGDTVTDLQAFYYIPAPYTLTDEDVLVTDGIIQSCTYNFALLHIIIPDSLDGQVVTGIAPGDPWRNPFGDNPSGVFEAKEIIELTLPPSLEHIGTGSFRQNRISNLDLSPCSSLSSIGIQAFYNNPIKVTTLHECSSLTLIDYHAFSSWVEIGALQLPEPDLPGYQFNHWADCYQKLYPAGDTIRNLALSYTAELSRLFTVSLRVADGNIPIRGAQVVFHGLDSLYTDSAGLAKISGILPQTLVYTIYAPGYNTLTDSVKVLDKDVQVLVNLELTTYAVHISVSDGTNPIEGAEVSLDNYGMKQTNPQGLVVFDSVVPMEGLTCRVSAPGFRASSISLSVSDKDLQINIILNKITGFSASEESVIQVYPNPTRSFIIVEPVDPLSDHAIIEVFNAKGVRMGKYLKSDFQPYGNYGIKIELEASGMYLLRICDGELDFTVPVVKH